MSRGKYLSLEEARKKGKLKRFAREHPAKADKAAFDGLLRRMATGKAPARPMAVKPPEETPEGEDRT